MSTLTEGSILRHLVGMAGFIAAGLFFQAAYFLVDLYFVAGIGREALAGVSAAGNFSFLALAGSQLVGVSSLSLISQAIGRRDQPAANLVFNQAAGMALIAGTAALILGFALAGFAASSVAADAHSAAYGRAFLYGCLPSFACSFLTVVFGSGLRAGGVVRPTMLVQSGSVLLNALLAPVLIAGVGGIAGLGAFGAGLASSLSTIVGLIAIGLMLPRVQVALRVVWRDMAPQPAVWLRLFRIGLPAAGEFFLMFLMIAVLYRAIGGFGAPAQGGYGIGTRILQAMFLPTMAIAFAAAPIAGQNYGAGKTKRVIATFRTACLLNVGVMASLTLLCQIASTPMVRFFTHDEQVARVAIQYLHVVSFNMVATGVIFVCSSMFQALGDTLPSFISSASRLLSFVVPSLWLSAQVWARLQDFWHVAIVSAVLQCLLSLVLLRRAVRRRLPDAEIPAATFL